MAVNSSPACAQCVQCRSLRLPLADFRLSRSQQRTQRRNAAIRVVVQKPTLTGEHIQLFNAYHAYMHAQRGWPAQTTHERAYFRSFLLGNWSFAREFLYYDRERLVGVGLADVTHEALSSIYFFHDPAWRPHAPGVFSILHQAAYARQQGLLYHYLGYWVAQSTSMAYKAQYRPHRFSGTTRRMKKSRSGWSPNNLCGTTWRAYPFTCRVSAIPNWAAALPPNMRAMSGSSTAAWVRASIASQALVVS